MTNVPRPEHPRPQFKRASWLNLNGSWSFAFDFGRSGLERGFAQSDGFDEEIVVPFAPETPASQIGYADFMESVWYQRVITIPEEWEGSHILLHFGAVDYACDIYIDGQLVGEHSGGSSSFCFDISTVVEPGSDHNLVVHALDDVRSKAQPSGKQSGHFFSMGCYYSRVTGIWQTVWLEAVHHCSLESIHIIPDLDAGRFLMIPRFRKIEGGLRLEVQASLRDEVAAEVGAAALNGTPIPLHLERREAWSQDSPCLYRLSLRVRDRSGEVIDEVDSFAGLRKIHVEGDKIFLNNEPLYLRFVLDQGYFPETGWTAPSDKEMKEDIERGLACGFNGARLHQKAFEERYHYWADTLGYLTFAESPSWGLDLKSDISARNFLSEWRELVVRDRNHPSIIAWTTLNETWEVSERKVHHRLHQDAYSLTHALDGTRPVSNASGGCQVKTDIYAVHIYEQDPQDLEQKLRITPEGKVYATLGDKEVSYSGQPYFIAEFGGIRWDYGETHDASRGWGYGQTPQMLSEYFERLQGQIQALLRLPHLCGFCFTQLTDVEQEQNGLFTYGRSPKFEVAKLREIFSGPRMSILMHRPATPRYTLDHEKTDKVQEEISKAAHAQEGDDV